LRYLKTLYTEIGIYNEGLRATIKEKNKHYSDVTSFVLRKCAGSAGWTGSKTYEQDARFLRKKYAIEGEEKDLDLAHFTAQDEFIKDLSQKGSYFSIRTLEALIKARSAFEEKSAKAEASLDEILKPAS